MPLWLLQQNEKEWGKNLHAFGPTNSIIKEGGERERELMGVDYIQNDQIFITRIYGWHTHYDNDCHYTYNDCKQNEEKRKLYRYINPHVEHGMNANLGPTKDKIKGMLRGLCAWGQ